MRLLLDLLTVLVSENPCVLVKESLKASTATRLVDIISGRSSRPAVKSALKALDHLVTKNAIPLPNIAVAYKASSRHLGALDDLNLWRHFALRLLRWMELHYVSPASGKLLMTCLVISQSDNSPFPFSLSIWHSWLEYALRSNPGLLEGIKAHILTPLFKSDRALSLRFIEMLNHAYLGSALISPQLDATALLQLAAFEVGKKTSLVDDTASRYSGSITNYCVLLLY